MFLVDTNVISESRKVRSARAAPEVVAWLKATDPSTTFISAMSLFELELGVVRVERLSTRYWSARFLGARRLTLL